MTEPHPKCLPPPTALLLPPHPVFSFRWWYCHLPDSLLDIIDPRLHRLTRRLADFCDIPLADELAPIYGLEMKGERGERWALFANWNSDYQYMTLTMRLEEDGTFYPTGTVIPQPPMKPPAP